MPRTKVVKGGKRNRDADVTQREEKLREFEKALEEWLGNMDRQGLATVDQLQMQFHLLIDGVSPSILNANFSGILDIKDLKYLKDLYQTPLVSCQSNDDGYLTEESANGGGSTSSCSIRTTYSSVVISQNARGRTPGPLTSRRRSRSACYDSHPTTKPGNNTSTVSSSGVGRTPMAGHASRSKMRTPMARTKTLSVDRSTTLNSFKSPPSAFLRWPMPGEMVVSVRGTPVMAQVLPDKVANLNIPMRDGVFSLRPKKLADLHPDLVDQIDPETLDQIKTLNANLKKIVSMAERNQQQQD